MSAALDYSNDPRIEPVFGASCEPLKIVIVGGGIGGLTAASGLRQNGHDVVVLEQWDGSKETGAAIHLASNSNGLLRRLGLFAETTGAILMLRHTNAFRFLAKKKDALDDPITRKFAEKDGELVMFLEPDSKVVTLARTLLNFVCIHPSEKTSAPTDDWNTGGSMKALLDVYANFGASARALLSKSYPASLKVWQLLDMETLSTWVNNELTLLGDTAHPFLPHRGQGGGQAIEDAAALPVVLPLGTRSDEVAERLKLYETCRYQRAHRIQEYTRQVGKCLGEDGKIDSKMEWLSRSGYRHFGMYIHGVRYTKQNGETIDATYMPLIFEPLTDPIVSGRDEFGMPKVFCDVDIRRHVDSYRVRTSWQGSMFGIFNIDGLEEADPAAEAGTIDGEADYGVLTYKYSSAVGERGKADPAYAVVARHAEESKVVPSKVTGLWRSKKPNFELDSLTQQDLPTLQPIVSKLAQTAVYEFVSGKVVDGYGVSDASAARRIE
ncbi:FAD/NAD(P)-binding domain-containing protein [Aureobasidium subglaciale]|nr:FAD/NAD(P)-binding domain-containing protein [Aureobasidium subglaciale]KAI5213310.1 FAD/NAD(P)-binding domain-containing protein [Aureobasidium subglaciale]KAI5214657.1 FAD/NAD(P)-binding domain-containing protein [Aureobasidium subglaciale]KAI5252714.1 FAD/NAD(P)-binding domain-containing protein [Aureobasidium subglaciale]